MQLKYPKVTLTKTNQVYVSVYHNNNRLRLFSGKRFNINIYPNYFPISERIHQANLLAAEVFKLLSNGFVFKYVEQPLKPLKNDLDYISWALELKLKENYSKKYHKMLKYCFKLIKDQNSKLITQSIMETILNSGISNTSFNTYRRHFNALINKAKELGMESNPMANIKSKRAESKLHKPIGNLKEILRDLRLFNNNLHLCALLTYGCLLRPHREILNLKWSDFSENLTYISLAGNKNKSKRNRVVPVPIYIREYLKKGELNNNIFSNTNKAYNSDYFKCVWRRFKRASSSVEQGITIYSFRHSGAIEIFKRTGSLTKLQKAMGHSSLNVSLTYLRGLEVAELKEEDMPMV
jgi:integrase